MYLNELKLSGAFFDLTTLEEARHLVPILGVRKLDFAYIRFIETNPNTATFCRIISNIFPNVQQLVLSFFDWVRMVTISP